MSNIYWFIGIACIGFVCAVYAIFIKKHSYKISTLLVFYLFAASIAWAGEFLVLGLFNSYAYKTGIFKDIWAQNLLGHLILNTTLYPSIAVIMVAFSFGYGWIAFSAVLFTVIEYVFIKLGLYEHHWWKYYMTTITVVTILWIDKKLFHKIKDGCSGFTRAVTFYFVAMIEVHIPAPILLLLSKQYYTISFIDKFFGNLYLSSIVIIFIYHLIEAGLLVLFTVKLKKWYFKVFPFIISIGVQTVLFNMGILVIKNGWSIIYTLLLYETFIGIYILIEKYTLKPDPTLF